MVKTDEAGVYRKLEEIAKVNIAWVSDDKLKKSFDDSIKALILNVSQQEIDQEKLLAALDDFADRLSNYLKDINRRACNLHEEFMESLPDVD